jgi:hypothetical protein
MHKIKNEKNVVVVILTLVSQLSMLSSRHSMLFVFGRTILRIKMG